VWSDRRPPVPDPILAAVAARFKRPVRERRWPSPLAMAVELEGALQPEHQRYVDDKLVALEDGEFDKLAISEPPQHGKSYLTTLWYPLWLLDTDPELRIVVISYNETFASSWGREAKRIIDKHADVLGWSVSQDSKANALWRVKGHGGGCMYIGVGGGLSGWTVHRVINDDWIKNHEDGFNAEIHEKNWTFHQSTVEQRLQHGVKEVCTMTRWSEGDIIGKLVAHAPDEWEVINLPAKAEEGDVLGRPVGEGLWLEKNPQEWYDKKEASLSAFIWAALWQQRPAPEGGGILKKKFFRYFTSIDPQETSDRRDRWLLDNGTYIDPETCTRFATADTAASTRTSADWTSVGAWAVTPMGDLLLFDLERARLEEDDLSGMLTRFMARNRVPWIGVEANFATSTMAYQLGLMGVRFHALVADADKLTRALPLRTRLEQRRLHFLAGAAWLPELEKEFMVFTGKGTGKGTGGHDDIVDMCAYASRHLDTSSAGQMGLGMPGRAQRRRRSGSDWRSVSSV
jgi:phage terminase large subunit-like protein